MKRTRPSPPGVILNRSAVSELLNLLNMSQTQLACRAGRSPGRLSLLMAGKRSPSPDARRCLKQALGVDDFDRLCIIEPAENPPTSDGPRTDRRPLPLMKRTRPASVDVQKGSPRCGVPSLCAVARRPAPTRRGRDDGVAEAERAR